MLAMKMKWFIKFIVLTKLFRFARFEFVYSMYNISFVPPLENFCCLSRSQIAAAQQRYYYSITYIYYTVSVLCL